MLRRLRIMLRRWCCEHSHTFKIDLPNETRWYSHGKQKGPHGPGLQLLGCYVCGKVWCRDYAA